MIEVKKIIEKKVPMPIFLYEGIVKDLEIDYFIKRIDENLTSLTGRTNVKGGMTDWKLFAEDEKFVNILN